MDANPTSYSKLVSANFEERNKVEKHRNEEIKIVQLHGKMLFHLVNANNQSLSERKRKAREEFNEANIDEVTLSKRNELMHLGTQAYLSILENNTDEFILLEKTIQEKVLAKEYEFCLGTAKKLGLVYNLMEGVGRKENTQYINNIISCIKMIAAKIPNSSKSDKILVENLMVDLEIQKHFAHQDYQKVIDSYAAQLKKEKIDNKNQITHNLISIYQNLGIMFLLNKNYKEAIKTLNQVYLKTNKDYGAIVESEIIFVMLLANIKLNQNDTVEVLTKDYLTVYQRNKLELPLRKSIVDNIQKNPFLDEAKMMQQIKSIVEKTNREDSAYGNALLNISQWLKNL